VILVGASDSRWRGWRTRAGVALNAGSKLACLPSGVAAIVDAVGRESQMCRGDGICNLVENCGRERC
jgi:hypothetical protein